VIVMDRNQLVKLYSKMSIGDIAEHLGLSKSTIYYYFKKFGIKTRSRGAAQKHRHKHGDGHPRSGKSHSEEAKRNISNGLMNYWDSHDGQKARKNASQKQKRIWVDLTAAEKKRVIDRLTKAPRRRRRGLSRTGQCLYDYLVDVGEKVLVNISLTPNDKFDLLLEDRKVAIKIIPIMSEAKSGQVQTFPKTLVGYTIIPYRTKCTSMSRAECSRIHRAVLDISAGLC